MEEIIISAIAAALKTPEIRAELETLFFGVVAMILHRRATDPNFIAQSDAAWATYKAAVTPGDQLSAQKALQSLLAS